MVLKLVEEGKTELQDFPEDAMYKIEIWVKREVWKEAKYTPKVRQYIAHAKIGDDQVTVTSHYPRTLLRRLGHALLGITQTEEV